MCFRRRHLSNHEAIMPRRPTTLKRCSRPTLLLVLAAAAPSARGGHSAAPPVNRLVTIDSADVSSVATSPDGRWVVYAQIRSASTSDLFVRPSSGGAATQLTPLNSTGKLFPRFSPTGDRVVYRSFASGRATDLYIMAVPFDARTGQATGAPRQVTLDSVSKGPNAMAISPDGKWVAYVPCCEARRLRVVPITGGNARTIVEDANPRAGIGNLAWTDDGAALLYVTATPVGNARRVMRVPVAGGRAAEVRRFTEPLGALAPGGHYSAQVVSYGTNRRQRELRIKGEDGSTLQRVRLPDNFFGDGSSWSPDGRAFVGLVSDTRAVIRIASTTGSPARTLTSGADYDWPDGWSPDSRTVYYETSSPGAPAVGAVTTDGAQRPPLGPLTGMGDYGSWSAIVGRYAIGVTGWIDSTRQRVIARNIDDGTTLELTSARYSPRAQLFIRGGGGTYSIDGNAYLYFEHVGKSMELRRVVPGERARVLRTFPDSLAGQMTVAVQNGRIIYSERSRDSVRFLFAANATSPARQIASVPAGPGVGEIAWTSDGRHVAFAGPESSIYALALGADGTPAGPFQRYQLPFDYMYELSFLNDGRRLAMIAEAPGGPNAVVALVALDAPSRPVILSEADGTSAWGHLMSPDGKWTAYAAELPPRGSTIYRVDLDRALQASAKR
jgi:Tol biopolymer transport system component